MHIAESTRLIPRKAGAGIRHDDRSAMATAFNFSLSPFDCLDSDERRLVRDSVDIRGTGNRPNH